MLNITNQEGNANQNHSEIPPHPKKNGYYQKDKKITSADKAEKREPLHTVGRNVN
jgi:hypothetical protein